MRWRYRILRYAIKQETADYLAMLIKIIKIKIYNVLKTMQFKAAIIAFLAYANAVIVKESEPENYSDILDDLAEPADLFVHVDHQGDEEADFWLHVDK